MKKLMNHVKAITLFAKNTVLLKIHSHVKYRIVGYQEKNYVVSFQCNVTRAFFTKDILDAIYDKDLIGQMSAEQACYLGLMAGVGLRKGEIVPTHHNARDLTLFGCNQEFDTPIIFDRYGNMIFSHPKTGKRCVVRPEHIVSKKELISLFSPMTACFIGIQVSYRKLLAPLQVCKTVKHLKLVKSA